MRKQFAAFVQGAEGVFFRKNENALDKFNGKEAFLTEGNNLLFITSRELTVNRFGQVFFI